jgi:hypothetical protein
VRRYAPGKRTDGRRRDLQGGGKGDSRDPRGEEIGCDECFEALDRFVTIQLSGLDTAEAMPLVHEHLHMCGECRDEFEALLAALRATGEA